MRFVFITCAIIFCFSGARSLTHPCGNSAGCVCNGTVFEYCSISGATHLSFSNLPPTSLLTSIAPTALATISSALVDVSFAFNSLKTIPGALFINCTQLRFLSLRYNKLEILPVGLFASLSKLQKLALNQNLLTTLPVGLFDSLTYLEFLNIAGNLITHVPATLFYPLTAIAKLYLYKNPWNCTDCNLQSQLASNATLKEAYTFNVGYNSSSPNADNIKSNTDSISADRLPVPYAICDSNPTISILSAGLCPQPAPKSTSYLIPSNQQDPLPSLPPFVDFNVQNNLTPGPTITGYCNKVTTPTVTTTVTTTTTPTPTTTTTTTLSNTYGKACYFQYVFDDSAKQVDGWATPTSQSVCEHAEFISLSPNFTKWTQNNNVVSACGAGEQCTMISTPGTLFEGPGSNNSIKGGYYNLNTPFDYFLLTAPYEPGVVLWPYTQDYYNFYLEKDGYPFCMCRYMQTNPCEGMWPTYGPCWTPAAADDQSDANCYTSTPGFYAHVCLPSQPVDSLFASYRDGTENSNTLKCEDRGGESVYFDSHAVDGQFSVTQEDFINIKNNSLGLITDNNTLVTESDVTAIGCYDESCLFPRISTIPADTFVPLTYSKRLYLSGRGNPETVILKAAPRATNLAHLQCLQIIFTASVQLDEINGLKPTQLEFKKTWTISSTSHEKIFDYFKATLQLRLKMESLQSTTVWVKVIGSTDPQVCANTTQDFIEHAYTIIRAQTIVDAGAANQHETACLQNKSQCRIAYKIAGLGDPRLTYNVTLRFRRQICSDRFTKTFNMLPETSLVEGGIWYGVMVVGECLDILDGSAFIVPGGNLFTGNDLTGVDALDPLTWKKLDLINLTTPTVGYANTGFLPVSIQLPGVDTLLHSSEFYYLSECYLFWNRGNSKNLTGPDFLNLKNESVVRGCQHLAFRIITPCDVYWVGQNNLAEQLPNGQCVSYLYPDTLVELFSLQKKWDHSLDDIQVFYRFVGSNALHDPDERALLPNSYEPPYLLQDPSPMELTNLSEVDVSSLDKSLVYKKTTINVKNETGIRVFSGLFMAVSYNGRFLVRRDTKNPSPGDMFYYRPDIQSGDSLSIFIKTVPLQLSVFVRPYNSWETGQPAEFKDVQPTSQE